MADEGSEEEDPRSTQTGGDEEDAHPSDGNEKSPDRSKGWKRNIPSDESGDHREDGTRLWNEFTAEDQETRPEGGPPDGDDGWIFGREDATGIDDDAESIHEIDSKEASPASHREASTDDRPTTHQGTVTAAKEWDADKPPITRDISDLQPRYRARKLEFYVLWLSAVLTYGVGDLVTTGAVLVAPRIGESNLVVGTVLDQFGIIGFIGIKVLIFVLLLYISVKGAIENDRLSYYAPPIIAVVLGTVLTLWNLSIILGY